MPYPTSHVIEKFTGSAWVDISADVVSDLDAELGLTDESYENRLADPGTLTFDLNNADGSYSPSAAFMKGTPIRVRVSYDGKTKTKFFGAVVDADVAVGEYGEQRVAVVCSDWLDYAVKQPIRERAVSPNRRYDEGVTTLLAEAPKRPVFTLIDTGSTVFPTIYDEIDRNSTLYRELNNLIISEYGYGYLDQGGERLRTENRKARTGINPAARLPLASDGSALRKMDGDYLRKVDGGKILLNMTQEASFTSYEDLKILHGKHVLNEVDFTVYPKKIDPSTQVLFSLEEPLFIPALGTVELSGYYSDPRGGGQIGATNLNFLVGGDYFFYQNKDETGTNLTSNLAITQTFSADRVKFTVFNSGADGWLTHLNQRGKAVYNDNPVSYLAVDTASREAHGSQPLSIRQPYQQDTALAKFEAERILDIEKEPRTVVIRADFTANASAKNMDAFMHVDIGNLIRIISTKPATDSYYYVNGIRWKITQGGLITFVWILKERPSMEPIAVEFGSSEDTEKAVDFGKPPALENLLQRSYSIWIYKNADIIGSCILMAKYSGSVQSGLFLGVLGGGNTISYVQGFSGNIGQWTTTTAVLNGLTGWHHIEAHYDGSSPSNDPVIRLDGVVQTLVENQAPAGTFTDDSAIRFMIGNAAFPSIEWIYDPKFKWKDARVYNRILNGWEALALSDSENNYDVLLDGLVFHAPFVRKMRLADYIDKPITTDKKIFDRVSEIVGVTHYKDTVSGWEIYGRDPTL